jgi:hypothetical protein
MFTLLLLPLLTLLLCAPGVDTRACIAAAAAAAAVCPRC